MDLERLDVAGNEIAAIQRCEAVPELESVSQGIGCMYVLEGSTLGGQIISRHLKETLAITPETGGAFFASYGPELGNRWKEFREAVCQDERSLTQADQIVAAARDTFQCFNDWLMAGSAA
jgi:heme oxygenase